MRKSVVCWLAFLSAVVGCADSIAQCPVILNCPQGSPIVCDFSLNDPLFWNEAPHTWSEVLEVADLYEGSVDLSLKILPCTGTGGNLDISYLLLLDLDNDNLLETAVTSDDLPPVATVFANNAFNPGYMGGAPVEFDKRALPDSIKFRFALEITTVWDTVVAHLRWSTGNQFVSPRLPEGRHYLKWRVQQGNTVKYCEHSFRVKDCQPPMLNCEENLSVEIAPGGNATIQLADVVLSVSDNATPPNKMSLSMRKAGDGNGFPLNNVGNPVTGVIYNCEQLDSQRVEVWAKDRDGNTTFCETALTITDGAGICTVFPVLCARTFWSNHDIVEQTTYRMIWADTTTQKLDTLLMPLFPDGCTEMNTVPASNSFSLVAKKDTNPLNGVSTFDLLLITKHILNIQPFDAPWKFIAADINRNGSVTTFDVVELRKLLLGIYNKFPANTSWRFFTADCDFPPNPFTGFCPAEYTFLTAPMGSYPPELPFNALKVGDVNGSADPDSMSTSSPDSRGEPMLLRLPDLDLEKGKFYEIPLSIAAPGTWLGFQTALLFDSKSIEIEAINPGNLPGLDENAFAQPRAGVVNVSWFNTTPQAIFSDEKLLTLRMRALADGRLSELVAQGQRLTSEAYTAAEETRPMQLHFSEMTDAGISGRTSIFPPQPNPTSAGATIPVRLAAPEMALVEVFDFSGKMIFQKEKPLERGTQWLDIPASALPQKGVYTWRVKAGEITQSGKLVRM